MIWSGTKVPLTKLTAQIAASATGAASAASGYIVMT